MDFESQSGAEQPDGVLTDRQMTRALFMRRSVAGAAGLSGLSWVLAACGGSSQPASSSKNTGQSGKPPARPTGTLAVAVDQAPNTLDPTLAFSVAELAILANVYEGLVAFDQDYTKLAPALATAWHSSDDAREWEFTLRPGVVFHDGTEFDATAVRKSIEYVQRKTAAYGFAIGAPEVDDSDPTKLVLKYKDPAPDAARNWTLLKVISPRLLAGASSAREKRVAAKPVGTGPFAFAASQGGRSVTLQANERHWGDQPHLQSVEFRTVPDEATRTAALQSSDVGLILQVPPRSAQSLAGTSRAAVVARPSWTTVAMLMDCSQPPFDDPKARQAAAYAIDRQAIVDSVLLKRARVSDTVVPPGVYGHSQPSTTYAHDQAKARTLLQKAGGSAKVRLAITRSALLASPIAQALGQQLRDGGFDVDVQVVDDAVLAKDAAAKVRRYNMWVSELGWVNGGPIHILFGSFTAATRFTDKRMDALVAKIGTTPDGDARLSALADAQQLLAENVPAVPLWVPERVDAAGRKLQGYTAPANVFTVLGAAYLGGAT